MHQMGEDRSDGQNQEKEAGSVCVYMCVYVCVCVCVCAWYTGLHLKGAGGHSPLLG